MKLRKRHLKAAAWAAGGLGGFFLLTNLIGSLYIRHVLARPRRKQNRTSDLSDFVPEVKYTTSDIRFRTEDNFKISAFLLEPEHPNGSAVVVCHGIRHNKNSGVRYVQYLLRDGYTLLLIDFRNHGDSDGTFTTYGYYEKHDLLAAVRYLRERVQIQGKIGVIGASMGASITLMAAAECNDIDAIVLDSPFASLKQICSHGVSRITGLPELIMRLPLKLAYVWLLAFERLDVLAVEPAEKAKEIDCPMFLIHGGEDPVIPVDHSRTIYNNASVEKDLWIIDDVGHLGVYLKDPAEYQKRVSLFFRKHLLPCA